MTQRDNLLERIFWLIKLRWIAIIGVILTVFFAKNILGLSLATIPLYILVLFLALYNLIFYLLLFRIVKGKASKLLLHANEMANLQISMDLVTLTAMIHFSGGIENPFIFYFIFHMIIASILLTRRASFLQATFAIIMFMAMGILEYSDILPHYCLKGFIPYTLHNRSLYMSGVYFVFITTLYIAVYMATSISGKLREREASLEGANKLLQEKDRIKSEYVLRVSHDIKEHLAAIESCIGPVVEGITGSLNSQQMNLLTRARERTSNLLAFVKALLEITRIRLMKKLKMEYFSVEEVVEAISREISLKAEAKGIIFKTDIAPSVSRIKGVRLYIEEAIMNLLLNSIKYTPGGGMVNLKIKGERECVVIEIEDSGIGIPEEDLSHIFEEFYRAENARKIERQGTGLGLSIVKEIVDAHKGEVSVKSKEGEGTTFYIRLPSG